MIERNLITHPLPAIVNERVKQKIPVGGYCHSVEWRMTTHGQVIKLHYCPFWYGDRPDGGCLLYGRNPVLSDAIKVCGINKNR